MSDCGYADRPKTPVMVCEPIYWAFMLGELLFAVMLAAVPQNSLDRGQQALQAGDLSGAEQLFRQYLSQNPNSAEALSNLGAICARRQQYSDAVAWYEKALRANPKLIAVHFNIAIALGQLKRTPGGETPPHVPESVSRGAAGAPVAGPVSH